MAKPEVVISGIGGRFPMCQNMDELADQLLANKTLLSRTDRWSKDPVLNVEPIVGRIEHGYFDDVFFGVGKKLSNYVDPMAKLNYMRSFEAILDAGLHPTALRGSNTAVYCGTSINEFEQKLIVSGLATEVGGYFIRGVSRAMSANRLSYYFDFTGSSVAVDNSFTVAHLELQMATEAIRNGECDAALVMSSNLARFPQIAWLLKSVGVTTGDGLTKSFDKDGTGAVRSDCAVAFLLQRADRAKRCYAKVLAAGVGMVGPRSDLAGHLPSPRGMQTFISDLYRRNNIDPRKVAYLEADGCGHPIRDECELDAIDAALVLEVGRGDPLLVGSIKSNIGHTGCVSGFAGICKAIVAMETGTIPATINVTTPNDRAVGIKEGRLLVADRNLPLRDGLVSVHTMDLFSQAGHTVLAPNPRPPQPPQDPSQHLPRLITVSGRTESCVSATIKEIQSVPFDTNYYRLVQDVYSTDIRGYNYRSHIICPPDGSPEAPIVAAEKRTVWFVYSGMGSQWPGMACGLMELPIFAETIERLHAFLVPKGLDLKAIITETGPTAFDNILKSFVAIAASQIALTNVLTALGIVPDGIIGHSAGELACAYGDGSLTEEETILAAWARGYASMTAKTVPGMMAAIGLSFADVEPRLPAGVFVACHNSDTSCTLTGAVEPVTRFVKELSDEGVFARTVNASDIAFHSPYIEPAGPILHELLKDVITEPKPRSHKWITTSVPPELRDTDLGKFCSIEYQVNNMLSPVLFEEALQHIPSQSVCIEIAPHGLMQAIVKRALPEPLHVPLTQRGHPDSLRFLLNAIGRIALGCTSPKVSALYPDVEFPVPRGTPSVARLVVWRENDETRNDIFNRLLDPVPDEESDVDSAFFTVNSTRVTPLCDSLMRMWQTKCQRLYQPLESCPVTFSNLIIERWPQPTSKDGEDTLIGYQHGTKRVELMGAPASDSDSPFRVITSATVDLVDEDREPTPPLPDLDTQEFVELGKEDIYRHLVSHGLVYSARYQNISSIRMGERDWLVTVEHDGVVAHILESVVQVFAMKAVQEKHEVCLPKNICRMDLDYCKLAEKKTAVLRLHVRTGVLASEGLYVWGLATAILPPELQPVALPSKLQFVPFGETQFQTVDEFLRLAVHSVQPTPANGTISLLRLGEGSLDFDVDLVGDIRRATGVQAHLDTLNGKGLMYENSLLVSGPDTIANALRTLASGKGGALLACSSDRIVVDASCQLAVVAEQRLPSFKGQWITLVRRARPVPDADTVVVQLVSSEPPPPNVNGKPSATIVLVWRGMDVLDVETLAEMVDERPYASRARMVFIAGEAAPPFSLSAPLYSKQLSRDERVNVLTVDGSWGCWRALPLCPSRTAALAPVSPEGPEGIKLEYLSANPSKLRLDSSRDCLLGHVDYVGVRGGKRVMGVAQWSGPGLPPRLHPRLQWPVPQGWSAEEAVTVPFVYALVYHTMMVRSETRAGESGLIHDGASAIGQAAIRLALSLGCGPIFTTVSNSRQRALVQRLFPELDPRHVLDRVAFDFHLNVLTRSRGVHFVVSTTSRAELEASFRCAKVFGRVLRLQTDGMEVGHHIGLRPFLHSIALIGVAGQDVFRCSDKLADLVAAGLRDGVVQPIAGAKVFGSSSEVTGYMDHSKVVLEVERPSRGVQRGQPNRPNSCYVVVGDRTEEAVLLADRLSLLGALHVVAVLPDSDPELVRHRRRALRHQGTHLHAVQVRDWDRSAAEGVVRNAAKLGALQAVVVIANDDARVASLLSTVTSSLPDVMLVMLTPRASSACAFTSIVQQRQSKGCRTACLAAQVREVVDYLPGLLSGASPFADVVGEPLLTLPSASVPVEDMDAHLRICLLSSATDLPAIGHAASRCTLAKNGVLLKQMPSLGPRRGSVHETMPLFVLPPLGVAHAACKEQLAALALRLSNPVFIVETAPKAAVGLARTARAIVQAMVHRQPHGPYNVLGWQLSTVLALEVQRQLESAGKRGVVFLYDGEVSLVSRWASSSPSRVDDVCCEADVADDPESQRGRQVLVDLLEAIAKHPLDVRSPFDGLVRIIRTNIDEEQSLDWTDPNISVKTIPKATLVDSALVLFLNMQNAHCGLAGPEDLRVAIAETRPYMRSSL